MKELLEKNKSKVNIFIMGITGAGKSTIINFILGLEIIEIIIDDDKVLEVKNKNVQNYNKIGHKM